MNLICRTLIWTNERAMSNGTRWNEVVGKSGDSPTTPSFQRKIWEFPYAKRLTVEQRFYYHIKLLTEGEMIPLPEEVVILQRYETFSWKIWCFPFQIWRLTKGNKRLCLGIEIPTPFQMFNGSGGLFPYRTVWWLSNASTTSDVFRRYGIFTLSQYKFPGKRAIKYV